MTATSESATGWTPVLTFEAAAPGLALAFVFALFVLVFAELQAMERQISAAQKTKPTESRVNKFILLQEKAGRMPATRPPDHPSAAAAPGTPVDAGAL
jgi:hypothetical protein